MNLSDYVIDILLIGIVVRQLRTRQLTARSVLLPLVLLAAAGASYLRGVPTKGNDLVLIVVVVAVGAVFGLVSGLATKVWTASDGRVVCKAGIVAATAWVLGMGLRMFVDVWSNTPSGTRWFVKFSSHHSITSADAYTAAFVFMAFAQVLIRVGLLQLRRVRLESAAPSQPLPVPGSRTGQT